MIGRQGSTGISTGPHLHYEIRKRNSPSFGWTEDQSGVVEPTQYLIDYYKPKEVKPEMSKEDVDAVIKSLSRLWGLVTSKAEKDEIHRQANAVRKAHGIPLQ